jgi:hypothetical protein
MTPLRAANLIAVSIAMLCWYILLYSGIIGQSSEFLHQTHAIASSCLFLAVAGSVIFWLIDALRRMARSPFRTLGGMLVLLVLCLACLSNSITGHIRPTRFDPITQADLRIRFVAIHVLIIPAFIFAVLGFWLCRLVLPRRVERDRKQSNNKNEINQ